MLIIGCIPVVIFALFSKRTDLIILVVIMSLFFAFTIHVALANKVLFSIARKTADKHMAKEGFANAQVFENKEHNSCASILAIDEKQKKIAYVSVHNPFVFQMADCKDLTNVESGYIEGPASGTRYVYYGFGYKKKRIRIPTFTSRSMYFLSSSRVQAGIAKAERVRDLILKLQKEEKPVASQKVDLTEIIDIDLDAIKALGFEIKEGHYRYFLCSPTPPSKETLLKLFDLLSEKVHLVFWNFYRKSISDPGAYVDAHVVNGKALIKQSNHGWSSNYFRITIDDLTELIIRNWDKDWDNYKNYVNAMAVLQTCYPQDIIKWIETTDERFVPDYSVTAW